MIDDADHHVCPWQHGALLTVGARKLLNNPVRIVTPYLSPGATAMDVGCGMGFFTIPMARIVGPSGRVVAVDLQPEMLAGLEKNAAKADCGNIAVHQCGARSLGVGQWDGAVDFVLVFYMLHEVPDPQRLVGEVCAVLKPGGALLFAEPSGHVNGREFEQEATLFAQAGLAEVDRPRILTSRAVVWRKAGIA